MTGPNAATVAAALSGRRNGRGWLCCCPAHADRTPSLSLADGQGGKLLVRCFAGCDPVEVLRAIAALDLAGDGRPAAPIDPAAVERDRAASIARNRAAWSAAGRVTAHDPVDVYLTLRGLAGPWPPTIRFAPSTRQPGSGAMLPAMVAGACRWPDRKPVRVQFTGLDPATCAKTADQPVRWNAPGTPPTGAAVRLSPWQEGQELVIAEGVEDGLALLQANPRAAVWAGLGAGNIPSLILPPRAEIILALDGDTAGRASARQAAAQFAADGHRVSVADMGDGLDPLERLLAEAA